MSSQTSSKKRKRADTSTSENDGQVRVSVYNESPASVGPVLTIFPSLEPPKSTAFAVYAPRPPNACNTSHNNTSNNTHPEKDEAEEEFARRRGLRVAGETGAVEFYSTGEVDAASDICRYLMGIYNKRTSTLLLRPAPLQLLGRRVKALSHLSPLPSNNSLQHAEHMEQRAALGETFGTKKARSALRTAERNRIDVGAMEGVVERIQEAVESGTRGLPTQDEAHHLSLTTRPIPRFSASASRAEDVYKISDIVPDAELHEVPISALLSAGASGSMEERMQNVPGPFGRAEWMRQHLERVFREGKPSKKTLRILVYIAILLTFRASAPRYCSKRPDLETKLPGVPSIVIDGVYKRFTETVRGSSETRYTSDNAVRLLTHVFALCLHVDGFATDTTLLAADLKESVTKINQHFKLLGCKIEKLSNAEQSRLGLGAGMGEHKRAVLRVPLEFPKARVRRRAQN